MGVVEKDITNIYEALQENFLYKNDITSIHMLLNLYDIEKNITNIFPRYVSIDNLKKYISRTLKDKNGHHLISLNLGQLIHEDINRLELYIYLEGYKKGYFNKFWVNILENITLENMSMDKLYNHKYLYHFDVDLIDNKDCINNIKRSLFEDIETDERENKTIKNIIDHYCNDLIRSKVMSLNEYMDKQLIIDYSLNKYDITEENSVLEEDELENIYDEILKVVYKNCMNLYKDAFWYGINDKVLKRYR